MPESMPATILSRPEFTPRQPRTERKTPRQVRDLPRGVDLPACLTGQCGNQAPPHPGAYTLATSHVWVKVRALAGLFGQCLQMIERGAQGRCR